MCKSLPDPGRVRARVRPIPQQESWKPGPGRVRFSSWGYGDEQVGPTSSRLQSVCSPALVPPSWGQVDSPGTALPGASKRLLWLLPRLLLRRASRGGGVCVLLLLPRRRVDRWGWGCPTVSRWRCGAVDGTRSHILQRHKILAMAGGGGADPRQRSSLYSFKRQVS